MIDKVMALLPHRYPFLMVDRIVDIEPGKKATAIKNVTINEPFFTGHFPGHPVMPGVMILEAMAQTGACALLADDHYQDCLPYLAGIDRIRFKNNVLPGDRLVITTELVTIKGTIGRGKGQVMVEDKPVCNGEFLFALAKGAR